MKEDTKSKLKKYGKRAGFGLALVSLFTLGVGVGACSARKAVGSSAEDSADVVDGEYNLLSNGDYIEGFIWAGSPSRTMTSNDSSWLLPVSYLVDGQSYWVIPPVDGNLLIVGYSTAEISYNLRNRLEYDCVTEVAPFYYGSPSAPFEFTYHASTGTPAYTDLYLRGSSSLLLRIVVATPENYYRYVLPSIAEITFPTDFNPIWLYGDAYKGAVYGMLSNNAEGASYTASLDVKFVSGGNLYDGIYFEFDHLANTWYQEPTSGEIVLADRNANNYHFPTGMYYRRFGQTASVPSSNPDAFDCVWSPQWALTNDSEGNTHRYLTPTGGFASDEFRVIDVKEYDNRTPVSARWPNLDALALLRLKSSGFIITGDTNLYDAFELLGGAFRSVSDILNIQILPFMTLGMLFFIPLIVLVLFAIIRILNK